MKKATLFFMRLEYLAKTIRGTDGEETFCMSCGSVAVSHPRTGATGHCADRRR